MPATILLLALAIADGAHHPVDDLPTIVPFDQLDEAHALRLDGQRVLCRVRFDTASLLTDDGWFVYNGSSNESANSTVWVHQGQAVDASKPVVVHGRIRVVQHKGYEINGCHYNDFAEIRLMDAIPANDD